MIFGNPYQFAIIAKTIKEWNIDETFCNGILLFCVNGSFFPKEVLTAPLNSEINSLKEKLQHISVDIEIFNMSKEEAFKQIYDMTFPEDFAIDNDYRFDITPLSFPEDDCYVFAVGDGVQVRILAAKLKYIKEESRHMIQSVDIDETFISMKEMKKIAEDLIVNG